MPLDRAAILALSTLRVKTVRLPDGSTAAVREMNLRERDDFEAAFIADKARADQGGPPANFRGLLLAYTLCDDDGRRLFGADDIEALGVLAAGPGTRLFDAAAGLNRITAADRDELEKNS